MPLHSATECETHNEMVKSLKMFIELYKYIDHQTILKTKSNLMSLYSFQLCHHNIQTHIASYQLKCHLMYNNYYP